MPVKTVVNLDIGAGNVKFIAAQDSKIAKSGFILSVVELAQGGALASLQKNRSVDGDVTPVVDGVTYKVCLSNRRGLTGATGKRYTFLV
jgi:hypothetical protein